MEHHNFPSPISVALVAMFFLLMLAKIVTMYYVEMLARDVVESKEILIRSSIDIETLKSKINAVEDYLQQDTDKRITDEYASG